MAPSDARELGWLVVSAVSWTLAIALAPPIEAMADALRGGDAVGGGDVRRVHALECDRRCCFVSLNLSLLLMLVKSRS